MSYKEDGKNLESTSSLEEFAVKFFGECPDCLGKLTNGEYEDGRIRAECSCCNAKWQFTILMRRLA